MKTAEQKNDAVQLAHDVLNLMEAEYIEPQTNVWVEFGTDTFSRGTVRDLGHKRMKCKVSADGALYVAYMKRRFETEQPEIRIGWVGYHRIQERLTPTFTEQELRLIDIAFEQGRGYFSFAEAETEEDAGTVAWRARALTEGAATFKGRMTMIMQNIIDNQGEFKP